MAGMAQGAAALEKVQGSNHPKKVLHAQHHTDTSHVSSIRCLSIN